MVSDQIGTMRRSGMAKWIVARGGSELTVVAEPGSGLVSMDVAPAGRPFLADTDTIQEIRVKLGAAIGVAQGELQ